MRCARGKGCRRGCSGSRARGRQPPPAPFARALLMHVSEPHGTLALLTVQQYTPTTVFIQTWDLGDKCTDESRTRRSTLTRYACVRVCVHSSGKLSMSLGFHEHFELVVDIPVQHEHVIELYVGTYAGTCPETTKLLLYEARALPASLIVS